MAAKRKTGKIPSGIAMRIEYSDRGRAVTVTHPTAKNDENGSFVMDREDVGLLGHYRWRPHSKKWGYVLNGNKVRLADLIMEPPADKYVHYVDGNPKNLRKKNLRVIGHSELMHSRKTHNASGYRGVYRSGRGYRAEIKYNYRSLYLGTFPNKILAAYAYNRAARKYFGKSAVLNIIRN